MKDNLEELIELERKKLDELHKKKGSMLDPEVLAQSKKVDELIVMFLKKSQKDS